MRKMFVLFLVVLLLVSFVAALPASARGSGKPGVTPPGWAQLGPQPGWTHVNPGQGGTEPPGAGHCYLHVLGGR